MTRQICPAMLTLLGSLILAGCAADPPRCPTLKQYAPEFRDRAANDLDLLPLGSPLEVMLNDYEDLRDQVAACGKKG
jgi:hypothetical protein